MKVGAIVKLALAWALAEAFLVSSHIGVVEYVVGIALFVLLLFGAYRFGRRPTA